MKCAGCKRRIWFWQKWLQWGEGPTRRWHTWCKALTLEGQRSARYLANLEAESQCRSCESRLYAGVTLIETENTA